MISKNLKLNFDFKKIEAEGSDYKKMLNLLFYLMLIHAKHVFGDLRRGFLSYYSHAHAYFTRCHHSYLSTIEYKYENIKHVLKERILDAENLSIASRNNYLSYWHYVLDKKTPEWLLLIKQGNIAFI